MDFVINYSWLIPILPLVGAAIAGLFGARVLKGQSHWPIWLGVGASAVLAIILMVGMVGKAEVGAAHHGEQSDGAEVSGVVEGANAAPAVAPEKLTPFSAVGRQTHWYKWFDAGNFHAEAGSWIDPLTAIMLCIITGIGFLITVFSKGYMAGEEGYWRFFAYLGLFIFMMTILVLGDNFIMLYLGWEGVGLSSYLLIGYYYQKPSAREAAKKAFLVNRVGDFGFGIGIMLIYLGFGTVSYFGNGVQEGVLQMAMHPTAFQAELMKFIPFLLMIGAFGKSAQFPLYVWLPDAMEGPTPVSALIHAATMVTAGVYMIVRCSTLFVGNDVAMWTIAAVGLFTAILSATIALRQFDLKKVFAYSTISQLGFMFVAVGVLAPVAGVFHLMTHAFFKALLFLSCGVVMHAMAGELDMRRLSGLKRVLPITRWVMLIGCLALAGFPFFSGFWSKDEIVVGALQRNTAVGILLLFAAFLTAYYTFRLYFRVFEGPQMIPAGVAAGHGHGHEAHEEAAASESAIATGTAPASGVDVGQTRHAPADHGGDHGHHNHEPWVMMLPLIILAIGALGAGYMNFPGEYFGEFLGQSPSLQWGLQVARAHNTGATIMASGFGQAEAGVAHEIHWTAMIISGLIAIAGIGLAGLFHLGNRPLGDRLAEALGPITRLLEAKYYVDEIYQAGIVEPLRWVGRICFAIDRFVVDGILWVLSFIPQFVGFVLKMTTQRGYLQGYAVTMLFGIVVILLLMFV